MADHPPGFSTPMLQQDFGAGAGLIEEATSPASSDSSLSSTEQTKYGSITTESECNNDSEDSAEICSLPRREFLAVICSLYTSSFLGALDVTIVTTLLTTIASDLEAVENISWIASAYLLSAAAVQPLYGKISDIFGRKPMLLLCCLFFILGCTFCAGPSLWWIVLGRLVAGVGGSGFGTLASITMSDLIPLRDRGFYQGLANIFYGIGAASGGIIGGFISDWIGWRWAFLLQVPLACIVAYAYHRNLHFPKNSPGLGACGQDAKTKFNRVDFQGSISLVACLLCLMLALSFGGKRFSFSSPQFIGLIAASLTMLGIFFHVERNVAEEPIIPLELLGNRTVLASSLTNWFTTMAAFATLFYVPVYFTSTQGLSATGSGLRLVSNFLGIATGSITAGMYMRKTGKYYYALVVTVGLIGVIGYTGIAFLNGKSPRWYEFVMLFPVGFSYANMLTVTLLSLISSVPIKYQALTTSIQYTFRSTGSTIGVSIASFIFQKVVRLRLEKSVSLMIPDAVEAAKIVDRAMKDTKYVGEAPVAIAQVIRASYGAGCQMVFRFSLFTAILGYSASLFMREHTLHSTMDRK